MWSCSWPSCSGQRFFPRGPDDQPHQHRSLIGSDADTRAVLALVLPRALKSRGQAQEFLLASQVRNEWLPVIPGVQLSRLTEAEISRHLAACGRYWILSAQRDGDIVWMELKQRCGGTFVRYALAFDGRQWQEATDSIRGGIIDHQRTCECLER